MDLEVRAEVLQAIEQGTYGTREVLEEVKHRNSDLISLMKEMEEEGLVKSHHLRTGNRGRPKKTLKPTDLGLDFLETYRRLKMKPLRARKEDLKQAVEDAQYTQRMIDYGHHPLQLFKELNDFAHHVKIAEEADRNPSR